MSRGQFAMANLESHLSIGFGARCARRWLLRNSKKKGSEGPTKAKGLRVFVYLARWIGVI